MLEHGGDLDKAIQLYGGEKSKWIDLSTGINPNSYPIPKLQISDWRDLPTSTEIKNLELIIKAKLRTSHEILLVPGAQIAINFLPFMLKKRKIKILTPTYNEYHFSFKRAGWDVRFCEKFDQLFYSKISIIVNPNNPDGKTYETKELFKLSKSVETLIIDESFVDPTDYKSIISEINSSYSNIIVIRSFGKFFGLAGMRLGFIASNPRIHKQFKESFGPWPVSKMSVKVASNAIQDEIWIKKTKIKLDYKVKLMDQLLSIINWKIIGGTNLFRLYSTQNSDLAQKLLAKNLIWSRKFSYSKKWLRLGIPNSNDFKQLEKTIKSLKI